MIQLAVDRFRKPLRSPENPDTELRSRHLSYRAMNVMKITRAANYALQAVAYMAGRSIEKPTASHIIARERGISEKFLLKVLKPLVSAQVLRSIKGPHGGYRLARPADEISMLEVVEAVDGPIRGLVPGETTKGAVGRRIETICRQSAEQQRKHLGRIKVSELNSRD